MKSSHAWYTLISGVCMQWTWHFQSDFISCMCYKDASITATTGMVFFTEKAILTRQNKEILQSLTPWICTMEREGLCAMAIHSVQQGLCPIPPSHKHLFFGVRHCRDCFQNKGDWVDFHHISWSFGQINTIITERFDQLS